MTLRSHFYVSNCNCFPFCRCNCWCRLLLKSWGLRKRREQKPHWPGLNDSLLWIRALQREEEEEEDNWWMAIALGEKLKHSQGWGFRWEDFDSCVAHAACSAWRGAGWRGTGWKGWKKGKKMIIPLERTFCPFNLLNQKSTDWTVDAYFAWVDHAYIWHGVNDGSWRGKRAVGMKKRAQSDDDRLKNRAQCTCSGQKTDGAGLNYKRGPKKGRGKESISCASLGHLNFAVWWRERGRGSEE